MEEYSCFDQEGIFKWIEKREMARIHPYLLENNKTEIRNKRKSNRRHSKIAGGIGKNRKDKGVRDEDKVARVPKYCIIIIHLALYMLSWFFTNIWEDRHLAYGLYMQLEITLILVYLYLTWNNYNLKIKRDSRENKITVIQEPYGLLGGNRGLREIILGANKLDYFILNPDDPNGAYLLQLFRDFIKQNKDDFWDKDAYDLNDMVFVSWLNTDRIKRQLGRLLQVTRSNIMEFVHNLSIRVYIKSVGEFMDSHKEYDLEIVKANYKFCRKICKELNIKKDKLLSILQIIDDNMEQDMVDIQVKGDDSIAADLMEHLNIDDTAMGSQVLEERKENIYLDKLRRRTTLIGQFERPRYRSKVEGGIEDYEDFKRCFIKFAIKTNIHREPTYIVEEKIIERFKETFWSFSQFKELWARTKKLLFVRRKIKKMDQYYKFIKCYIIGKYVYEELFKQYKIEQYM